MKIEISSEPIIQYNVDILTSRQAYHMKIQQ